MTTAAGPINALGQRILAEWRRSHPTDSVVFSPLAVAVCFNLLYPWADGRTRTEIEQVFGFGTPKVAEDVARKADSLLGSAAKLANRVYSDESVRFSPSFVAAAGRDDDAKKDFRSSADGATVEVDDWILDATNGFIPVAISREGIRSKSGLVAVSAFCFCSSWQCPFLEALTREDVFHSVAGDQTVPFMRLRGARLCTRRIEEIPAVMLCLPYKGGRFSLYVLLPDAVDGWRNAEKTLPTVLSGLFSRGYWSAATEVRLPKWELECGLDDLKEGLQGLGLIDAFSPNADFGATTMSQERLHISDVVHRTKIAVHEEEGEQSATVARSVPGDWTPRSVVAVDRPFLYFVVDETDQSVLCQGTQTAVGRRTLAA